ncbi:MAG: alcohol dehydrogenase catalytic domain-containing protein [Anaerolineaceae bacterium]|jgi:threonine dehydrogenase-like Zn-dependent dehydrogenase
MKGLWLEDREMTFRTDFPMPVLDSDEVLIKVLMTGICSTDLEMLRGYYPFTGIPGHEFVGQVADANGHSKLQGKRVIGDINISCGECERCLHQEPSQCMRRRTLGIFDYNGVFAEFCKLPVKNLTIVPDPVSDFLAVFTEPTAAALRILDQVQVKPSDRVILVGAGRLGLLIAQALKNTGCDLKVVVRRPEPATILEGWGIRAVYADALKDELADIVVEATGSPEGFELSRSLTRARGTLVLKSTFAGDVNLNLSKLVVDEITLIGSRCGNYPAGLRALASGLVQVGEMVDSVYSLDEGLKAIERASQPGVLKVLIRP